MLKVTAKFRFVDPGGEAGDIVLAKGELLSLPNVLKVPLAPQPATPTLKSCVIDQFCVVGRSPAKNCLHQTDFSSKNPPRATTLCEIHIYQKSIKILSGDLQAHQMQPKNGDPKNNEKLKRWPNPERSLRLNSPKTIARIKDFCSEALALLQV